MLSAFIMPKIVFLALADVKEQVSNPNRSLPVKNELGGYSNEKRRFNSSWFNRRASR